MAVVGTLKVGQNRDRTGWVGRGQLKTMRLSASFTMHGVEGTRSQQAPSHRVICNGSEIGAAWMATLTRGDFVGRPYWTLSLDDPSFDKPLRVAAFPRSENQDGTWEYDLVWQRPVELDADRIAAVHRAEDRATGSTGAQDDDEIPF